MSHDLNRSSDANVHQPHRSEPHAGHGGTKYEGVDASLSLIGWSLATIVGTLIITLIISIIVQKYLYDTTPMGQLPSPLAPSRVVPPSPQLWVHPWEELPDVRADEDRVLNSYGKGPDGHARIPIDRAMAVIVPRLNVRPYAPQGIITPGGEGRDFATSVNAMPAPYRGPQIQGEIHKNAKQ
jgi:hypothetical protein